MAAATTAVRRRIRAERRAAPAPVWADVVRVARRDDHGTTLHVHGDCGAASFAQCPPDGAAIDFDITRATGAVTGFVFSRQHLAPDGTTTSIVVNATGYPDCAASRATPPTWVPAPVAPQNGCLYAPAVLGCSRVYAYTLDPASTPAQCPAAPVDHCKNQSDGYITSNCAI